MSVIMILMSLLLFPSKIFLPPLSASSLACRTCTERDESFEFRTEKSISNSKESRQPEASRVSTRVGGKETAQVSIEQYISNSPVL